MQKSRRSRVRRGLIALEWIMIVTVLVIGILVGLGLVRNAVVQEMFLLSESILDLQVDPNAPPGATSQSVFSNDFGGGETMNNLIDNSPDTILDPTDPLLN